MKALFVLTILQLVAAREDARLGGEIDESHLDMAKRDFHARKVDGALGAMMVPRADPGAVASEICGYQGGQISSYIPHLPAPRCHLCLNCLQ